VVLGNRGAEGPHFDCTAWPIVVITLSSGPLSDAGLSSWITDLTSLYARRERFAQVIDVRLSESLSPEARRRLAEMSDRNEDSFPGQLVATAIVLSTPFQRGVFKAMTWLTNRRRLREAFTDLNEALRWARGVLRTSYRPQP
jgi:hypothetical protein